MLKDAVGVGQPHPPPQTISVAAQVHVETSNDNNNDDQPAGDGDVDAEKHAANTTPAETGVIGIQAAQAMWGRHGRLLIFAGYFEENIILNKRILTVI